MRGILAGSLLLIALQAALSSDEATSRVGKMLGHLADLSRRLIDPGVAAIPDLAADAGPLSGPGAGRGGAAAGGPGGAGGKGDKQQQQQDDTDWWNPLDWRLPPGML